MFCCSFLRSSSSPSHRVLVSGMPRGCSVVNVSFGRQPVIITNGSVVWTLPLWALARYPHQEARNNPSTADEQPKTVRKRPKRCQQGPKRAPKRAKKGPKNGPRRPRRASGRPKSERSRIGPQPRPISIKSRADSGLFWGPFWAPSWAPNRPKLALERVQKRRQNLHAQKYPRGARK